MGYKSSLKAPYSEARIQKAIQALKDYPSSSIRAVARSFEVSHDTLRRRVAGGLSHSQASEMKQILSNAEEKTIVRWTTRLTRTGSPMSPTLLVEIAELIRRQRVRRVSGNEAITKTTTPIGHEWLYRFLNRHPTIKGIYARQMENARFDGASYEVVKRWFDAVATQLQEHTYEPQNIWNMDESGFGVGESQTTRVLVPIDSTHKHKRVAGKQEWITDIECINAAGGALTPMIIFKAKNLNTGWLPPETPANWHFGVSENGWTSNDLGLNWLIKVFEPQTRERAGNKRRLLIADGHGSHIRADFIAHCMENGIDLLIMPPHCSHLLQPLDVGVFSAFKRAHANETDAVSRHSSQRISRVEWMQMFIRARRKAITSANVLSGWRGAGLVPSDPKKVLDRLPAQLTTAGSKPRTPPGRIGLDFSLLKSSPPDGTELRDSNVLLNSVLTKTPGLASPARRYVDRVTRMTETLSTEVTILRKQLQEKEELLQARKMYTRGKRVKLKGEFVYSSQKVLAIAREAEVKPIVKQPRGRPRKRAIMEVENEEEAEILDNLSSVSECESVVYVARTTRSMRVE